MTIRHLKIFVSVCEYGKITRVAEALHITQPAISHTIAELEKYYQVTLFDRINQRLVLTEFGKEVLSKAREIVHAFEEFESFISYGSHNPRVRIGCSPTLGQTIIPRFMQVLQQEYPQIQPNIIIKPSSELEAELEGGSLDFALLETNVQSPYLKAEPFQKERILFVTYFDFDVPSVLMPQELERYPLLLRERGSASRTLLEQLFARQHLTIEPTMESSNNQAMIAALYASVGIALLPESYVKGHIARGKLKEITVTGFDGNHTNHLVMHKNKRLHESSKMAYQILKNME